MSLASNVISALRTFETGQFFSACERTLDKNSRAWQWQLSADAALLARPPRPHLPEAGGDKGGRVIEGETLTVRTSFLPR